MSNLREKIKNIDDIKKEILDIPEWECSIEIRSMTAKQRANILDKVTNEGGSIDNDLFFSHMIVASCFDSETGELIFDMDDANWIMDKSSGPIEKLMSNIMRISGLNKNSVEEAEKN
ncbi:MAG: hypothetical protein ACE5RH_00930 [Nitrosarchaeum sp.]